MIKNTKTLKKACEDAVASFLPEGDTSFCNVSVAFISKAMGYVGFTGMMANEIVGKLKISPDFAKVEPEVAQNLANDGNLVIAGIQDDPHGHVACLYPGGTCIFSGKWGCMAPLVANVGKTNRIMGANYAFGKKPEYWAAIV